jgi:signal transduction histidine kinase
VSGSWLEYSNIALIAVVVVAGVYLRLQLGRRLRQVTEERDRYLAELAVAEREREVATDQIGGMLARVTAVGNVLDAVSMPVWRRRKSDLSLFAVNQAYAQAIDGSKGAAVADQRELAIGVLGADGRALALRARATGAAQRESQHIVIGGSRRFLEITETPLAGLDEIVGFARDFTDLENFQSELTRHTEAHAEILENVAVAIAIYGPDTKLGFFNRAFAALWRLETDWLAAGPPMEEVLERLREQRRLPEHVDFRAYKRGALDLFTSLIAPQQELMHLPDGRTLRLAVAPHPFGGLIFVYEDVTDRLALERSVNTLSEVQRETLDNLGEGIAVIGTDGKLKLWNPAFAVLWRIEPSEISGEPHIGEIVEKMRPLLDRGEDWPAQRRQLVGRHMTYGAASERIERRDGSILQFGAVPLPDGNMLFSYLDITDTTRLAAALEERNAALEAADRLKSEFIANVSYELRTPLNVIVGFSELLTNQYFGALNPRQLEYSTGILDSGRALAALISDILDLATIQAGYLPLEIEDIDIDAMMSNLHTLCHERARARGLTFRLDCPADIGAIRGDKRRLTQALFNLLSNALKFTASGGGVTLAARRGETGVAFSVSDTGSGVPVEDHARLFGKFDRGTAPTRTNGAGLGLSLAKSIIELHGGRIELDAVPGVGTAVTCHLPG